MVESVADRCIPLRLYLGIPDFVNGVETVPGNDCEACHQRDRLKVPRCLRQVEFGFAEESGLDGRCHLVDRVDSFRHRRVCHDPRF